jgi:ring-1,2-phenylacetyl-CoA epoxidase subunit PaaE
MDNWIVRVKNIIPEATDMKTILLERVDGRDFPYLAGQFLTFLFNFQGRELRRSYSFSTTPGVDPSPGITIKRVTNGEVSRWLLDRLRVGDELVTLPPAGRFTLKDVEAGGLVDPADLTAPVGANAPRTLFFIAAGSGMVPVFSLLKEALAFLPGSRNILLTQQHDEAAIPFLPPLLQIKTSYSKERFQWINLLTDRGRLNNWRFDGWIDSLLQEGGDPFFFICGPPAFMRMVQFTLRWKGFSDDQIKMEKFTVEFIPPPPPAVDPSPKKVTVYAGERVYSYEVAWPATILQAGLNHGIPLPYSCRAGRCSTCVARCLNGKVKMSNNEVLTEKDLQEGLVLPCVGYAMTDVEIGY